MLWGEDNVKICLLGEYDGRHDEGMRAIANYLYRELCKRHQVMCLSLAPRRNILSPLFYFKIQRFDPDIIHFVPGLTIRSLLFVKILKRLFDRAKTIVSATHPILSRVSEKLVPFVKPDLILTQSNRSKDRFMELGCSTEFLPSGVDIHRFLPVSRQTKQRLRRKYGIHAQKIVVLHVGHIKKGRNILILNELQKEEDIQVIIVGSLSEPMEKEVYQALTKGGCIVWRKYFDNIAEIYALADCYVFLTLDKKYAIEMPLSVIEAMSCNLRVISTPFEALPELFTPGEGLIFVEENEIPNMAQYIRNKVSVKTRKKVLRFNWENIVERLEKIYHELL